MFGILLGKVPNPSSTPLLSLPLLSLFLHTQHANSFSEIYYTTHQFFLSERSIYLVVWNLLEGITPLFPFSLSPPFSSSSSVSNCIMSEETASRIEFWLQSINARANGAGVILVGTHADEVQRGTVKATLRAMREKYVTLVLFFLSFSFPSCFTLCYLFIHLFILYLTLDYAQLLVKIPPR